MACSAKRRLRSDLPAVFKFHVRVSREGGTDLFSLVMDDRKCGNVLKTGLGSPHWILEKKIIRREGGQAMENALQGGRHRIMES